MQFRSPGTIFNFFLQNFLVGEVLLKIGKILAYELDTYKYIYIPNIEYTFMNNFKSALLKIKYLPQVTILNTFKPTF